MKIGIVSNLYPPDARGGAELVAQRIACALYERGHEVFVLTTQPFDGMQSLFPTLRERTVESVYRFYPANYYYLRFDKSVPFPLRAAWHLVDLFNPFSRAAIRRVITKEKPDVVITHNLKGIGVSIGSEIQKLGIPHIHTLHDIQLSVPSGLLIYGKEDNLQNRPFLRWFYEKTVERELGRPNLILSPSRFLKDFYRSRAMFESSRFEILPNPLPSTGVSIRLSDSSPGPTRFLFAGQLENSKGIETMLDAFDGLDCDYELHIAGEGSLSGFVAERAMENTRLRYHGFVSLGHLIETLKTTDATLVPSVCYENSPTIIYESFAVGVPVIASNIGGIPELILENVNGLLVRPGDSHELALAMKKIHDEKMIWNTRARAIHEQAQRYSIDNYVKTLEKFILEILNQ